MLKTQQRFKSEVHNVSTEEIIRLIGGQIIINTVN